jgi:hypothetical protein
LPVASALTDARGEFLLAAPLAPGYVAVLTRANG